MTAVSDELARLVGYVFGSLGRRRISEDDWVRVLALERKWVPPSHARRLAGAARALGFLRNAGERDFEIGLEAEGITLPLDYRPDLDALAEAPPPGEPSTLANPLAPPFRRIVRAISERLGSGEAEVVGRINSTQQALGGLLTAEVAALYWGTLQGVDLRAFYDEVQARLRA